MSWKEVLKATEDDEPFEKKGSKPDYIDIDGDGNKKESMKQAAKDKKGRKRGTVKGRSAFTSKD
tara:strand:+ start:787 stop:978 length:192 start_codon:yes stop_codon:yes gene_type:complete